MATETRTLPSSGTTLANGRLVSDTQPQRPMDVWRGRRNFFFVEEARIVSKWAIGLGAFVHAAVIALLIAAEYPPWRIVSIGAAYVVFGIVQRFIISRGQDERCIETSFIGMNVTAQVFVTCWAALTGGLHSPLLPAAALPSIVSLLFFGPIAASRWIALCNGLLIVAMLSLPPSVVGPTLPNAHYAAVAVVGLCWSIVMLHALAGKMANAAAR